ncbi:MAG: sugar phosphate isomerase/epimerase family protein, partial [Thermomicrobiales bacterium]
LSEVHYFHSFSMEEDPLLLRDICADAGVKVSSLSGHSPLMKPEAAVERLTKAIVFASMNGAKFVNSDEMIKPGYLDDEFAHDVMRYSLMKAEMVARRHGVYLCLEPHGVYTKTADGLLKIVDLVPSPWIQVNWDTGNAYLAGIEDPYESLEKVRDRVFHVHAKDISMEHGEAERGKVTGTPVGCACGEGLVDWERVLHILDPIDRDLFLSVECGTIDQAERSLAFLTKVAGNRLIA